MQLMDERPKLPHYDPDYCQLIAKWSASICVGLLVTELLVLLILEPSSQCPGWTIYAKNGSARWSLWVLAGMFTAAPTIWICYVALRWKQKFSEQMYDSIAYGRPRFPFSGYFSGKSKPDAQDLNFQNIFLVNANWLFLVLNVGWCLFCMAPLWMMLTDCTKLPRYLGY
jgi:hypothetical protein